jgi:arylsulfatase
MEDPTESNDLAAQMPDKLKQLQELFYSEAEKYDVLPLDNSTLARFKSPKPNLTAGRTVFNYSGTHIGIPGSGAPNIMNKSYTITADVDIPKGGGEGMIVTDGGRFGGYALFLSPRFNWWSHSAFFRNFGLASLAFGLFLILRGKKKNWGRFKMFTSYVILTLSSVLLISVFATRVMKIGAGRPVFIYNLLDLKRTTWSGSSLSGGKHTIVFDFEIDSAALGAGGTGILSVDGKEVSRNSMEHGIPITFPEDESFDVGNDTRTGVSMLKYRYDIPFPFTGNINKLTVYLKLNTEPDKPQTEENYKQILNMADSVGVEN